MKIILVIMFSAYSYGSSSTKIPGFSTIEDCHEAKQQIVNDLSLNKVRYDENIRAFCVKVI